MVKPAPAVVRATRLLDLMASQPRQPYSLTQLANALDASLPSTMAILESLAGSGYVVRHPVHKTFMLGPALHALGEGAAEADPLIVSARAELDRLAAEIDAECVASVATRNEMVFVAVSGRPRSRSDVVRVGVRIPLRPPFGVVFAAWAPEAERERWVRAVDGAQAREEAVRILAGVRARGYLVQPESPARSAYLAARHRNQQAPDDAAAARLVVEAERALLAELVAPNEGGGPVDRAGSLVVPVFDDAGHVALAVTAQGFARPLSGVAAEEVVERVRASALFISSRRLVDRGRPSVAAPR